MEDYYYFAASLETTAEISTSFRVVHSSSSNRSSPSPSRKPRRASSRDLDGGELGHHYLHACFRCARTLARNRDIFMYRGDAPFCSEECRQQQIDSDEAAEKRSNQSAAATREQQTHQRKNTHRVPVWAR
uniref:Uncharacterized protein n=1 Tax=Avena sativa TaxID=4498 RepID=A0ACD5ZLY9_AVESA